MQTLALNDLEQQSAGMARRLIEKYVELRGYEGETETQIWHLLMDLVCLCKAESIDLDKILADVRAEAPVVLGSTI